MKKKLLFAVFSLCLCAGMFAQKSITGTVRDALSEPLPGVSVTVKGSQRGTVTDIDGNFSIPIQSGDKSLLFTFIGMENKTVNIENETHINVVMTENVTLLNEVVVSALGIRRENKSLT
ncbi:MAG: carboxypeptidase-like regulatory domain-containing protein, partial [Dysgonamonadaceae bacterium]|nr:carboxypeptidase-like regulatory domain-containing protein [Dysgonamonadaceae bacterium]